MAREHDIEVCELLERVIELKDERHQLFEVLATVAYENYTLRQMLAREFIERVHADGRLADYHRRNHRHLPRVSAKTETRAA